MLYEFLPHTADVKFRAYGKSLEEAFSNAALALTSIIVEPEKVEGKVEKVIEVSAEDDKALLYDFLEQFLVLLDTDEFVMHEVKEISIEDLKLKAKVTGDNVNNYKPETHIKAITYQEMEIQEEDGKFMVQVVPDL